MRQVATVSTLLLRPLTAALASAPPSGRLAAFYRAIDVTPEIAADPDARVSPAQLCVAWAEATRLSGDPALALSIAEATPRGAFGIVEYICRAAPTLRDALAQWVRYLRILDDAVEVALVTEGEETSLRVLVESDAPAPGAHELCFALVIRHARDMLPCDLSPTGVRFAHRARGDISRYEAFFQCPVDFDARVTEIRFPDAVLDTPLTTSDPTLLSILLRGADQIRSDVSREPPLTEQVRRALRAAWCEGDAQMATVAQKLGLSRRSLQRRLGDEGTSFQEIRDSLRLDLAERFLQEDLSFAEISFLLGFSEPSAFFRAFKRWTGRTPSERRGGLEGARLA